LKKFFFALSGLALSGATLAQGFAGTKSGSAASTPASGSAPGIPAMLQMLVAVGIVVFLLKAVLPRIASKVNKKLVTGAASSLKIEESANFAGGSLYVVRARRKTILLGVTGTAVTCLADLTEEEDAQPLPPTFNEILVEAEVNGPEFETAEESAAPVAERPPHDELERVLSRLQRLSG
jgi:flagellar biogenesis protein FliO